MSGSAVHTVELVRRRQRVALARCLSASLERPVDLPEALADSAGRAAVAQALHTLDNSGLSGERPYFGLCGPGAFVKRRIRVPREEEASHDHLEWEARQFLDDDLDDFVVDTLVTARRGFVVAARRQILELYGVLCREARLQAPGFDMVSFALCNALEATGAGGAGAEIILLAGGDACRAVLLYDGEYEAEGVWPGAEAVPGVTRLCAEVWGQTRAERLWLAGDGPGDVGRAWSGVAGQVADLDPFAGLRRLETASVAAATTRMRAFAVAAGLAWRGLADA